MNKRLHDFLEPVAYWKSRTLRVFGFFFFLPLEFLFQVAILAPAEVFREMAREIPGVWREIWRGRNEQKSA